jgi:flagellar basal body rod protein FlgG
MNVSIYQAAAAMNANARWQEVVSENLAASSLPGYKKQDISFSAVEAGQLSADPATSLTSMRNWSMPSTSTSTNFRAGELRPTSNPLDFAIEGAGFFEVQMPDGKTAYTRDGEFKLNAQGQLVTKQGYQVMGDGGQLQFDPANPAPITVSPTGDVSQGGEPKGRLRMVEFPQPELLSQAGAGYFIAQDGTVPLPATSGVRQGFLEAANTSSVNEMVNLISSMRMFEANQRVIQSQDERMGRVISEVGNPS